jgi:hypothetical protein
MAAILPISLPAGHVLVYGMGTTVSPSGVENTSASGGLRWGNIYQIWDGGETYVYGGDNIMFKETDVVCRLAYGGIPYTLVPARLATIQEPLL